MATTQDDPFDLDDHRSRRATVRDRYLARGVRDAPSAWRLTPVGDLGLADAILAVLEAGDVTTAGELVEAVQGPAAWLVGAVLADVEGGLTRLRCRLSNAGIEDYDLARWGEGGAFARAALRGDGDDETAKGGR